MSKAKTVPVETPLAPYDPTPYQQCRDDIREVVDEPLRSWTFARRNREAGYLALLTMPLDLAAAGFTVTLSESDAGWCLTLTRELQPGRVFRHSVAAHSYAAMLSQLATTANDRVADLERRARRAEAEQEVAA